MIRKILNSRYLAFVLLLIGAALYKYQYRPVRNTLGLHAEMWAEAVTNYFNCAHFVKGFGCYLVTDAGYLAFLPRIYSQIIEAIQVPLPMIAQVQQATALVTLILCCCSVALKRFEPLYGSTSSRTLLAILFLCHTDYELHTFINASYYLIIPAASLLAVAVVDKKYSVKDGLLSGFFVSLAILSKGVLVCLIPMVALAVVFFARQKRWRDIFILSIPVIFASALQIKTMIASQTTLEASLINRNAPLVDVVWTTLATFVHGALVMIMKSWNDNFSNIALSVVVLITGLGLAFYLGIYAKKFVSRKSDLSFARSTAFWMLFGGALGAQFVAISGSFFFPALGFPDYRSFPKVGRTWFIQVSLLLLTLWSVMGPIKISSIRMNRREKLKPYLLPFVFLLLGFSGAPFILNQSELRRETREKYFSNWKAFAPQLDDGYACAPLNPYPWFFGQNCRILNQTYDQAAYQDNLRPGESISFVFPESLNANKIRYVGFFVSGLGRSDQTPFILSISNGSDPGLRLEKESLPRNKSPYIYFLIEETEMPRLAGATLSLRNKEGREFTVGVPDLAVASSSALWFGR
jgi:hypothetical protein